LLHRCNDVASMRHASTQNRQPMRPNGAWRLRPDARHAQ